MDKKERLIRALLLIVSAGLMAGCTAGVAVRALGFEISILPVYLSALTAAAFAWMGARGSGWAIGSAAALLVTGGVLLLTYFGDISALLGALRQGGRMSGEELIPYQAAGSGMAMLVAFVLGALFYALIRNPGGTPFALMILLAGVICALAMNENVALISAAPGLIAAVAAFSVSADKRRDGLRAAVWIPAAAVVLLALLFTPARRTTWAPLENLATRIRSVVEDYVHFTEERVAFSINEEGYDRAGWIGDSVVSMLGGPANPSNEPVMEVATDHDLLLRGTIRRSYTGYSWIDDQAKARYLYYDFTHRGVRDSVFDAKNAFAGDAFSSVTAQVTMEDTGTSTLFVPTHMSEFDMDMANAVYYNSAGEIFLTREVRAGDAYSFTADVPVSDAALIAAASAAASANDGRYQSMIDTYTGLPEGIDSRVYALAVEITRDNASAAEKALAIENYLAQNYGYTLSAQAPADGQDFVSFFLLEAREGYCSYFASAMTVMCRIAGIPARYVEGYAVRAEADGVSLVTGQRAHAWTEVYLNGLGWVAMDPTARTTGYSSEQDDTNGDGGGDSGAQGAENSPTPTPTPSNTPDPGTQGEATPPPQGGEQAPTPTLPPDGDGTENTPTPAPNGGAQGDDSTSQNAPNDGNDTSDESPLKLILGILLVLLLIAAAAWWVHRRLLASDPLKLVGKTRDAQTAAMILYRAILTLLAETGQAPLPGETPAAFAVRTTQGMPNPAYLSFVDDVAQSRYSGRALSKQSIDLGRRAYVVFLGNMHFSEKLRFTIKRVLHGLGSFDIVP